ncbi:GAF domain-containing protein [Algivirga pacifica]|uniref:GAF domain-containing protein n=1 Tax=Algivirga pacifica TaxID=1162670 RepID=A0ABP9DP73_9BACT
MSLLINAKQYPLSYQELEQYNQSFYQAAFTLFNYLLLLLFSVSLVLSLIYDTWGIALGFSLFSLTFYILMFKYGELKSSEQVYLLVVVLLTLQLQFTFELKDISSTQLLYFTMMTLLVLFRDWRVLLLFYMANHTFYLVLFLFTKGYWIHQLLEQSQGGVTLMGLQLNLLTLLIVGFLHFCVGVMISILLNRQSIAAAKQVFYLEKQMNLWTHKEIIDDFIQETYDKNYPIAPQDEIGNTLINLQEHLQKQSLLYQQESESLYHLHKFNKLLLNCSYLEEVSHCVVKELSDVFESGSTQLYIIHPKEKMIELLASYGVASQENTPKYIPFGEGLLGEAIHFKNHYIIKDIPETTPVIQSGLGAQLPKEIVIVPLQVKGNNVGVVVLNLLHSLDKHHLSMLGDMVQNIGVLIQVHLQQKTTEA